MLTLFDVYDAEGGFHYSWRVDISVVISAFVEAFLSGAVVSWSALS